MRLTLILAIFSASLVLSQDRCDAAKTVIKCHNVTEIMALESSECQPYHIFIARGTDEKSPGRQGNVTRLICDKLGRERCGWEGLDFPAKSRFVGQKAWCESAEIGVKNGQTQLHTYAARCPESKLILLGYSQGASIVQDMLGGGGGHFWKCDQASNRALDRQVSPGSNIVAAVTFGSVARSGGQPYAVKEGREFNGTRTRTPEQVRGLNQYASQLRDYCNFGDPICARESQPQSLQNHLTYFELYSEEIVSWVVKTVRKSEYRSLLSSPYWLIGATLFFVALSWSVLYFYSSFRRSFSRGAYYLLPREEGTP